MAYKDRERQLASQRAGMKRIRYERKAELLEAAGGACSKCGYSRSPFALDFHHLERVSKTASVSHLIMIGRMDLAREEAKKCVLLCANCHREEEWCDPNGAGSSPALPMEVA